MVNNLALITTLIISALILVAPRRYVIILILVAACYLPLFSSLNIGSLNFSMVRIIIAFTWIRFIIRREFKGLQINKIDVVILIYLASSVTTYTLLRQSSEAFINRCGMVYDIAGAYFIFRILIKSMDDIIKVFKIMAILVAPIALAMIIERFNERNVFTIFGSPAFIEGYWRGGKIRCLGPFAHPSLAGSFGATCATFFCCLLYKKQTLYALLGIISSMLIVLSSNSSGPVITALAVITGLTMWNMRNQMKVVRWVLLIVLLFFHFAMKSPVWFLIGKLGHVIGGGGWHRSEIIEAAVTHFSEWWMLGTIKTRHWMPTGVAWSEDQTDITNQFVRVGIDGGLITLIIYIYLLVLCFSVLGKTLKIIPEDNKISKFTIWTIGTALFAHIVTFFSVRYFDQNVLFFYMLIAIIALVNVFYNKEPPQSSNHTG